MEIEEKIFKKYKPDFKKIKKYGFSKVSDGLKIEKLFMDNAFRTEITISNDGKIKGKVIDLEADGEYLPLRAIAQQGAFVGSVRENYEKVLSDIRDNCFYRNYFALAQSNRITDLIIQKYSAKPEFLWEKLDGAGVFRNSKTKKWFGIIMDVEINRIDKEKHGIVDIMNVKLSSETLEKTLKLKGFYPAYHMNKKYWITYILDDTIKDEKILELIEESYNLVNKK